MDKFLEDQGKSGHGFTSADILEEVDIGNDVRSRPTIICDKLYPRYEPWLN
jgi:hypothetical protein